LLLAALPALVSLLALTPARAADPHTEYMLDCMGCHQANGAGVPGRVPDMRGVLGPLAATAAGRRYLIEVPGVAQAPLSNAALADLLNWMVQDLGDAAGSKHFIAFTPAEVASFRKTPLAEVTATRQRLLAEVLGRAP
jgi:mono/diheme cytochrome c family protein